MADQHDNPQFCPDANTMHMFQAFALYMQQKQGILQTHANQLLLWNPIFGAGLENKPNEAKQSSDPDTWQQEMMQQLALQNAKHAVFDKQGIFDGYDPVGYLQCYEEELKLCRVAKENYIQ